MSEDAIFSEDIDELLKGAGLKPVNGEGTLPEGEAPDLNLLICNENMRNLEANPSKIVINPQGSGEGTNDIAKGDDDFDEDDDDDEFECDIEKYVPFASKIEFAEKLKNCSQECLTQIIKFLIEHQPMAVDDFGHNRAQVKVDMVERDVFTKC
mmetsp:Transcript_6191/g.10027  ORF Transcript_6191/g.10027 Transcript_6191/m.10027 type:complete len:153 (-) Transcript_6191:239-697(-)